MQHQLKTIIFKILESLPRQAGDYFYHQLQHINSRSIPDEYSFQLDSVTAFAEILNKHNLSFKGKKVLEIGSGWLPVLPYELIFHYHASVVHTVDINKHYLPNKIEAFNNFYRRLHSLQLYSGLPTQVKYFPNTNVLDMHYSNGDVDVVITRNVLEHITPEDLYKIHHQANRYLNKSDGFVLHQISPSDHRAYRDNRLSLWDFLKYSDEEWNRIQTRFDYHNRWRLPHYIELFKKTGFRILYLKYSTAKQDQKLPDKIHVSFQQFTPEELTAGNIIVLLKPLNE